jgi:hypothetical protein
MMKRKSVYVTPTATVVVIATAPLLTGSPFETVEGETTGSGFVDVDDENSIPPRDAL